MTATVQMHIHIIHTKNTHTVYLVSKSPETAKYASMMVGPQNNRRIHCKQKLLLKISTILNMKDYV